MDVNTGYVLAMVGGRDFERSPYNRAASAKIQSGSAFKPFIYVTALKKGYEPGFHDFRRTQTVLLGYRKKPGLPENYDGQYAGRISIKDAVAYSKNAATVKIA